MGIAFTNIEDVGMYRSAYSIMAGKDKLRHILKILHYNLRSASLKSQEHFLTWKIAKITSDIVR